MCKVIPALLSFPLVISTKSPHANATTTRQIPFTPIEWETDNYAELIAR